MGLFTKEYQVRPNQIGYLFRDHILEDKLTSGRHEIFDWRNRTELICLPQTEKLIVITNQEVLTKDNIALRFSFNIIYKIIDGEKFLSKFESGANTETTIADAEQRVFNIIQVFIRNKIASFDSEELNEKRTELSEFKNDEMENHVLEFGISLQQVQLKDVTFPKAIQDLFAKHLEAKIRAKADLENARTAVATARTLKNASELMKGDDNIKFFQFMETITKIAAKGKHTFMVGDFPNTPKQ